jgi:hypothetical protein
MSRFLRYAVRSGWTARERIFRDVSTDLAAFAVMLAVAIWIVSEKKCHLPLIQDIPIKTSVSQFDVHFYCSIKQEQLFCTPAETIGLHHIKQDVRAPHDTYGVLKG